MGRGVGMSWSEPSEQKYIIMILGIVSLYSMYCQNSELASFCCGALAGILKQGRVAQP
jgi:hypothetical protein